MARSRDGKEDGVVEAYRDGFVRSAILGEMDVEREKETRCDAPRLRSAGGAAGDAVASAAVRCSVFEGQGRRSRSEVGLVRLRSRPFCSLTVVPSRLEGDDPP
jgi:hypothetical protein